MKTIHPGRSRGRRGLVALSLAMMLGVSVASCTPEEQEVGGPDQAAASQAARPTGPRAPGTSPSVETDVPDDPAASSASAPPSDPADEPDDSAPDAPAASDVVGAHETDPGGEAADGGASEEDISGPPTASAVPTTRPLPAESTDAAAVPPGFSSADSVLTEDAFDGPDLRLASVTTARDDALQIVFLVEGTGYPGWEAEYVAGPSTPGTAPATSELRVRLVGVDAATSSLAWPTSTDVRLEEGEAVEGDLSVLLHLHQGPAPFRVHLQHAPLRVVVEITKGG